MAGKAGDGDKRTVTTDALETLGTIITPNEKRDAIHLAVEPVIAGESMKPGNHVVMRDGLAYGYASKREDSVGIVDPFLTKTVYKGDRFWLVIYPRIISSLRHVWTHPQFADEIGTEDPRRKASVLWIEQFAMDLEMSYYRLMDAAEQWAESKEYTQDNSETYKNHWTKFEDFWKHYEIVTGQKVDEKESFFTCSC